MPDLSFDDLRWLQLRWAILLVAAFAIYGAWQRRRALRLFADAALLERLAPRAGWWRPVAKLLLLCAALVALTAALIGPRYGEVERRVSRRNIDVFVLLDVSRSMLARDLAPNRLERAKLAMRDDLLPALGGDRIGLIAFAGLPVVKCPLTSDYGFFRLALEDIGVGSVPRGGTLIGDAIRKAIDSFDYKLDSHKVILLITDGEDHASYPREAAAAAWSEHKIPIIAVALGDERQGARVPAEETGEKYLEYKGETVWSRANFDDLRYMADLSDLKAFIPVGTRNFDLGDVYRRVVPALRARETQESQKVRRPSWYHPFAVAALALVLIESLIRQSPRGPAALPRAMAADRAPRKGAAA